MSKIVEKKQTTKKKKTGKGVRTSISEKQKQFCQEYLVDLNATQAAIRTGYEKKSAAHVAYDNLKNPLVLEYLRELREGVAKRNRISQDELVRDLLEIKNRCMQNVPVMYYDRVDKEWKPEVTDDGAAVYKFDSQGATKALDLLGKIIGAYERDNEQKALVSNKMIIEVNKMDFEAVRNDTLDMFDE